MNDANEGELGSVLIISGHTSNKNKFRRILAQICVTVAQSLLLLDLGMMIAVPTIVIGQLHDAKEGLSLNDAQSSWFGSIMLLCQPLGSVLSGCAQGLLGRKKSMLLVNVPHLAAWYLLYSAQTVDILYFASFIMGIGIGFLEAPTLAYIGEISEPRYRGMLATFANSNIVVGHLLEFGLGCLLPWRVAMLVCCSVPLIAFVTISLIPESPVWLLTRGRKAEALESLRWLRGWVSVDEVSDEFRGMELYCQRSKNEYKTTWEAKVKRASGYTGVPDSEHATEIKPGFMDGIRDLLRPAILRPLLLVGIYFFFFHAASLTAMRPYMIEVFTRLQTPLPPNVLAVMSAVFQATGALTCIILVHPVGKRTMSLVSMTGCTLCCLSLGVYTYASKWYSVPSVPLYIFCTLYFCINLGISPIPWLLISEVFPTRGRGIAGGVCAALFYVLAFLVSKTWLNLQSLVELHGCFFLYGILSLLGILYLYVYLPETEGKTLAEIETYFTRKK